jgi:two-component system chemotaxis response regulator CheB
VRTCLHVQQARRLRKSPDEGHLQDRQLPIIALVGSAGGLDAAARVLAPLPGDLAASIIVLIHVPPDRASRIVEVISRRCSLPVVEARDGLPLCPRQVIVVPPGRHLLITADDRVLRTALIVSGAYPPSRPSADLLLATLATAVGSRAIAVILSGGGNDGATGATAVHVCGGTVLATDETSSNHYSMPLAAIERDEAVDQVLPLDEIADALIGLVGAARTPVRTSPPAPQGVS